MRFSTSILSLALAVSSVLSAPTALLPIEQSNSAKNGRYIVMLKEGVSKDAVIERLGAEVTYSWDIVNGFAGTLNTDALNTLRASADVESIAEDGKAEIFGSQTNAPWGLQRITQDKKLSNQNAGALTYTYTYDDVAGAGVDVYVVDTGIYTAHPDFGGRARWGATYGGYPDADGHGHGTHCAGTIGSASYGVAKNTNIVAVKVLGDDGSGEWSDIISGLDFVLTSARASGRPSIVSMSLGGPADSAVDKAVDSLTKSGVHVVVAAGNSNTNAQSSSPARVPSAVTVGASGISDARASFSNYGPIVDIFAPGLNVISTWTGGGTNSISGTSMATPHVAGALALLISRDGNSTPAAWSDKLKARSVKNALTSIPGGTANNLLRL